MNRKIISILCLFCLICSISATAYAQSAQTTIGTVWFNADGKTMSNDFQKNLTDANVETALKERLRSLQPGDDVTFTINLRNDYSKSTNWYMTNRIVSSLEEGAAKDGAYTYHLWYKNNTSGKVTEIFESNRIGGVIEKEGQEELSSSTGLMEINDAMKEDYENEKNENKKGEEKYFYLDNLSRGQGGQVFLTIELDGETQGNDYQDRLADLKMNFAVQVQDTSTGTSPGTSRGTAPKTGDEHDLLPYYIAMIISGLLFLYFALDSYTDRLYKKGRGRS